MPKQLDTSDSFQGRLEKVKSNNGAILGHKQLCVMFRKATFDRKLYITFCLHNFATNLQALGLTKNSKEIPKDLFLEFFEGHSWDLIRYKSSCASRLLVSTHSDWINWQNWIKVQKLSKMAKLRFLRLSFQPLSKATSINLVPAGSVWKKRQPSPIILSKKILSPKNGWQLLRCFATNQLKLISSALEQLFRGGMIRDQTFWRNEKADNSANLYKTFRSKTYQKNRIKFRLITLDIWRK